jgi:hypothetical protein
MRTGAIRTGGNCPIVTMYSCRLLANLTVYNKNNSHLPIFIFSFLVTTHVIIQLKPIKIKIGQYKKKLFQFKNLKCLRVFAKQT